MDYLLRSSTCTCQVGQSPPSPPSTIPTLITRLKQVLNSEPNSPSLVVMLRVEEPQSHSTLHDRFVLLKHAISEQAQGRTPLGVSSGTASSSNCTTRRYRNKNSIIGLRSVACTYFLELTLCLSNEGDIIKRTCTLRLQLNNESGELQETGPNIALQWPRMAEFSCARHGENATISKKLAAKSTSTPSTSSKATT